MKIYLFQPFEKQFFSVLPTFRTYYIINWTVTISIQVFTVYHLCTCTIFLLDLVLDLIIHSIILFPSVVIHFYHNKHFLAEFFCLKNRSIMMSQFFLILPSPSSLNCGTFPYRFHVRFTSPLSY